MGNNRTNNRRRIRLLCYHETIDLVTSGRYLADNKLLIFGVYHGFTPAALTVTDLAACTVPY
jgi:hypothetical protein